MPDSKITALTSISTSTDPANDPLVIVDVSDTSMAATGTTKKVTLNQLLGASGTATLASATITGDLTVDTSTLKVDSANNRVGVGTATPDSLLQMAGAGTINWKLSNTADSVTVGAYAGTTTGTTGTVSNHPFFLFTNNTERYRLASDGVATWSNVGGVAGTAMTLNATGLGVGIVPSSFGRFSVQGTAVSAGILGMNTDATRCDIQSYNVPLALNRAGNNITMCEGGGNVGIGVTPSAWWVGFKAVESSNGVALLAQTNVPYCHLVSNAYDGATNFKYKVSSNYALRYAQDATTGNHIWFNAGLGTAGNNITFTQAMTLDASGNLLVGKTAASVTTVGFQTLANGEASVAMAASTGASTTLNVWSTGAAAYRFYVGMNGTISATNTTISAISDARLKENVQDIDVGLGAILALKPRKFDWKAGKGKDIKGDRGFIAQEFEQVFPNLIDEWKDPAPEGEAPYKSVRQDLIPVLVKAIQELAARVQTLETR